MWDMNEDFPKLVKRLRQKRGLKTFELAAKLERPSSFVSRIETGAIKETPPPYVLHTFRDELGAPVSGSEMSRR